MEIIKTITLDIAGPGIILYSPFAAAHIAEGEDYLSTHYSVEEQVQPHIQQGTLVGFGTSTPGAFTLNFLEGYPDERTLDDAEYKLRLGIHVKDGMICVRDLFDLLEWSAECPPGQTLEMKDGFYHLTLHSDRPASGILGDGQVISVYSKELPALPALNTQGVPTLC